MNFFSFSFGINRFKIVDPKKEEKKDVKNLAEKKKQPEHRVKLTIEK